MSPQQFINQPPVPVLWLGINIQDVSKPQPFASIFEWVYSCEMNAIFNIPDKAHVLSIL